MDYPNGIWHIPAMLARSITSWFLFCFLILCTLQSTTFLAADSNISKLPPPSGKQVDFLKDIQPILEKTCYECHGGEKQKGGLRLDIKEAALKGGDSGPLFVSRKSGESLLIQAVAGTKEDLAQMPKKRDPLTAEQIGLLRAWIDQGANWPETAATDAKDPGQHWAFKAPVRPDVPVVKNKNRVRTPIDNFILARMEKEGLKPSPEADKVTLLRRLHFDLTGLPPTPVEVDAFLADKSPDAYEKVVEKLFASPHYGERMAMQWLDLARYADTHGYHLDSHRDMWPWRDWVIKAFNQNMPYDRFTIEQLAGDL